MVEEEGLEARWGRHRRHHLALAAGLGAMGLSLLPPEPERLWTVNAVRVPEGIDEAAERKQMVQQFDIEVGGGLGPLAGKIWRVGLMGASSTPAIILLFLGAFESVLRAQGAIGAARRGHGGGPRRARSALGAWPMRAAAMLALVAIVAPQSGVDAALADLQRRRVALIRAYDLEAERPRLDRYARTCARALRDPALARQEPIGRLPFVADDRQEFLQRTAALVVGRLGVRLSGLSVKFSRLPRDTAGRVRMAGNRATIEIADRHRDDDEQILAVLAHEFAHIVLDAPDSGVSPREADDEELADAMVVMAGMGPLLLRSSYREGQSRSEQGRGTDPPHGIAAPGGHRVPDAGAG